MEETQVWPQIWKDPLEEEMATHSNILTWEIPWTEEPGVLQFMGSQRVRHDWPAEHTRTPAFPPTSLISPSLFHLLILPHLSNRQNFGGLHRSLLFLFLFTFMDLMIQSSLYTLMTS